MLQLDGFPTGDAVKADRSAGRLTGSMMELQTLQEALKVEIQIHQKLVSQMKQDPQNADLKKQLHELQANITALSEKQKKVVEQLRKELMKQEPEGKLYLQTPAGGDVKQSPQQVRPWLPRSGPGSRGPALAPEVRPWLPGPALAPEVRPWALAPGVRPWLPRSGPGSRGPALAPEVRPWLPRSGPGSRGQALAPEVRPWLQRSGGPALAPEVRPRALAIWGEGRGVGAKGRSYQNDEARTLMVTPLLTTKTLPLVLKALPPTVAVVTAAITKPDLQSVPINLQVAGKLTNQSAEPVRLVTKNAMVMQATTTSAQPIKVPQFVPPPRLTPRPTYQPQVRPKPPPPSYTNVHIAPAPPPPHDGGPPAAAAAPHAGHQAVLLLSALSGPHPPGALCSLSPLTSIHQQGFTLVFTVYITTMKSSIR
ncbi:hypothetical protein CgunFtcFv8_012449 [Champsocephalus gunnari]|uniref:PHD finger protein 21A n=1 Tax=Champsocephalus gunnari TaxID=52237 RepID=A0AAN8DV83_CHAGU|nr:hypothetical protein CgunFtcFv8_012449 [Champsocephalus gunnari]